MRARRRPGCGPPPHVEPHSATLTTAASQFGQLLTQNQVRTKPGTLQHCPDLFPSAWCVVGREPVRGGEPGDDGGGDLRAGAAELGVDAAQVGQVLADQIVPGLPGRAIRLVRVQDGGGPGSR